MVGLFFMFLNCGFCFFERQGPNRNLIKWSIKKPDGLTIRLFNDTLSQSLVDNTKSCIWDQNLRNHNSFGCLIVFKNGGKNARQS